MLKAGADTDRKDGEGMLALDLAPDKEVSAATLPETNSCSLIGQVRKYIERAAEMEGIDL